MKNGHIDWYEIRKKYMIRKLKSGYRIYSRKADPKTGKRKNLGTFDSLEAAKKHEREIQVFKHKHWESFPPGRDQCSWIGYREVVYIFHYLLLIKWLMSKWTLTINGIVKSETCKPIPISDSRKLTIDDSRLTTFDFLNIDDFILYSIYNNARNIFSTDLFLNYLPVAFNCTKIEA